MLMPVDVEFQGCVKNNFPFLLGNHPTELEGYFEMTEVIFDRFHRNTSGAIFSTSTAMIAHATASVN
jgi:hypothetical protein